MNSIASIVKQQLERRNMTMEALADSFEMSRASLYNKLSGKNHLLFSEAIELAKWLDVSIDELGDMIYSDS